MPAGTIVHWSQEDLQHIPLLNLALEVRSSAPSSPAVGYTYYDSVIGAIGVYTSGGWLYATNSPPTGSVTSAMIADGTIVDADISGTAAIAQAKLALSITNAEVNAAAGIQQSKLDQASFNTAVRASRLDQMAAPNADVSLNSHKITNLATPTQATDAATKAYTDSVASGLNAKSAARAASNTNIGALSGTPTIDGYATSASDRVLLMGQTTASANGIWVVHAGAWTRPTDFASGADETGAFVFVETGTNYANNGFVLSGTGPMIVDTDSETWVQFTGAGEITAGSGLNKSGNTLSVATGGVTSGMIADGTIVDADISSGAAIAQAKLALSITDAQVAAGAAIAVTKISGAVRKYATTLSTSSTSYTVTHSLGTNDVHVTVLDLTSNRAVDVDWGLNDTNSIIITTAVAPAANQFRVIVMG